MKIITENEFEQEVLQSEIPVVVDFFAEWCMPCKMFGPVLESAAETFEGKVKIVKVNIDENPNLAQKYMVMSIPTIKMIRGGEVKGTFVGTMTEEELEEWIEQYEGK